MRDLYDKLVKILELEVSNDFDDSAVIGGLEGFLAFWIAEARSQARRRGDHERIDAVANRLDGYGGMANERRADAVRYLIERLGGRPAHRPPPPPPVPIEPLRPTSREPEPAVEPSPRPTPETPPTEPLPEPPRPVAVERQPAAGTPLRYGERERARAGNRALEPDEARTLDRALDRPVTDLKGVGGATAERLARLDITTIRELLYHAPFRYEDYTAMRPISDLTYGDEVTVAGVVQDISMYRSPRGTLVINAVIGDGTGTLRVRWFGNRYLLNTLRPGTMVRLSGRIDAYMGKLQLNAPRYEVVDLDEVRDGRLIPVYPRTEGLGEKTLARAIASALEHVQGHVPDPLPPTLRERFDLVDLPTALNDLHQPKTIEQAEAARRRLAFDELLRLQLGLLQQRREWKSRPGRSIRRSSEVIERFLATLPFELTRSQRRALDEILSDQEDRRAMSRLLQGDVGSGKTVVAAAALLNVVAAGYQGAMMAPTEILAEQHYQGLREFLNPEGPPLLGDRRLQVALLTGSTRAADRAALLEGIRSGEVDVVVGTHALIQDGIEFRRLGLAIVDEQHRFGVRQRAALRDEGVDLLVMSATPIPRSLAMTLYGDLDLSVIDEMPPGRQPIVTRQITPRQRERAYTYIRRQVSEGRQAFVICPLVEESETLEARAAVEEHRFLQEEVFPEFDVGLLHGRLRGEEKEREMTRFYRNESQILVSTSVVEVGIDVPNATVMLIEGANRFGLAQLHQFRGRIGRGQWRSLCLLMAEEEMTADGEARLHALVENADGFALAEKDLEMRGPGDFFGTRQSGLPELRMARLGDSVTLSTAREAARLVLDLDPDLAHPAHQLLAAQLRAYWDRRRGDVS